MVYRIILLVGMCSVGGLASAWAGTDVTPATAALIQIGLSAQSWGFAIAGIAFVTAIAAKLLEHFYDVRSLSGSAVNVIIGVALISSVVAILGTVGVASGAEPSDPAPVVVRKEGF